LMMMMMMMMIPERLITGVFTTRRYTKSTFTFTCTSVF